MNFNKFINSDYLKSNPLCGIDTYKDELNLATGACTRQIKKLVLTGEETSWNEPSAGIHRLTLDGYMRENTNIPLCTHYIGTTPVSEAGGMGNLRIAFLISASGNNYMYIRDSVYTSIANFKSYLAQQYANGTPVTVWYVLATAETETVTVPSGLSGIVEGSLTQTGTPTPTNPIYPTANTVEQWFDLNHYIHNTSTDTITTLPAVIHPTDTTATVGLKGQMLQSSVPSPTSPIMPQGCGDLETSGAKAGQYKIPISSANTTTPVYLGEVQTMRKIKKLVLDGTESWNEDTSNYYIFINISGKGDGIPNSAALSTHTESGVNVNNNGTALFFKKSVFVHSSLADFKSYLAQQYANGTPVTVWYVLSSATTGIVNEPIRKIGTYADEVSGVSIPVTAGANTLSVGTTLQPSEVSVNYKGWHPVVNAHEYDSNYTIATMQALTIAQLQTHTISGLQGGGWS